MNLKQNEIQGCVVIYSNPKQKKERKKNQGCSCNLHEPETDKIQDCTYIHEHETEQNSG